MKHNQAVCHSHHHDNWTRRIKTWFNQPARKQARRNARLAKARRFYPSTIKPLKPAVHCMTQRYNYKLRLGRGFSKQELRAAHIDMRLARTIGIAVDPLRINKSQESLERNVARLQKYMEKLVVLPRSVSDKSYRIQNEKKNIEKRKAAAEKIFAIQKAEEQKVAELNKKIAEAKEQMLNDKSKAKEVRALIKATMKERAISLKKIAKEQKRANVFVQLPVKQVPKEQIKQMLDANTMFTLKPSQELEVAKIPALEKTLSAHKFIKRQRNVLKTVGQRVKMQKKLAEKAAAKKK